MVLEPASGKRPRALTDFIDEIRVRFVKMKTGQFATLVFVSHFGGALQGLDY
jgi:hypothetical protein